MKVSTKTIILWVVLLILVPTAVLILVPSPCAKIVDLVQPLNGSEDLAYEPELFYVTKYGLIAAISALFGLLMTMLLQDRQTTCADRLSAAAWGSVGALLGARLLYMATRYSYIMVDLGGTDFLWQFWQGGYTLYGGLLGGMAAIAIYARVRGEKIMPLLDAVTPGGLLTLCGLRVAESVTGQGFSKLMDDIGLMFLPFQTEDETLLVWAYEAIAALIALAVVLYMRRKNQPSGRTMEAGLSIVSAVQILLDSWRADELIRFGFVRLNMLAAALTLLAVLTCRIVRCIRRDGKKQEVRCIIRGALLLLGAGACIAVEFALDKSAVNNGILYIVMMAAVAVMLAVVLMDDGRTCEKEERN